MYPISTSEVPCPGLGERATPTRDATVSGFLSGPRTIPRRWMRLIEVAWSSTASAIGCTTSICMSRIGATSAASPSTYAAMGSPRFPALTYVADRVPMTVWARSRRQTTLAARTYSPPEAMTPATEAVRVLENTSPRSASASTVTRRAGLAT
jgi:hypothetical protein